MSVGATINSLFLQFLDELERVRIRWRGPWCIGGDFNEVRDPFERSGGGRISRGTRDFGDFIDQLELREILISGLGFT